MVKKSATKPVVWVLMGLLILGLGGFGATNLGGSIRSIGSVGNIDLSVQRYFNGLQQEIQALQAERDEAVRFSEAQQLGLNDRVLNQMIVAAAFENEAQEVGISVGDENLRDEILAIPQFHGLDGSFDREAYRLGLQNAGLTESQFEASMRSETASNLLRTSVISGIGASQAYTDAMMTYLGEQREVSWSVLERTDITAGLPVPTEEEVKAFYNENEALFTIPESKRIAYAWLTPDMIVDTVEVDEQSLREAYDAAESQFNQPERRLVERLIFGNEADLDAAKARIDSGEAEFEQIVEERGLNLSDIDLGDLDREALGDLADPIFDASVGDVVGPLETSLGPALFRINAILSAQTTTYEEAEPLLRADLAADRAARVVDQSIDAVRDLLAGGATIEDVAEETDMELGQIDWHEGISDGIAAYPAFRQAAATVTANDYPDVEQFDDGGIFTIQLVEIVPPTLQPFEEVRDAVEAAWTARTIIDQLTEITTPLVDRLNAGESFQDVELSIDGAQTLTRQTLPGSTPADFVNIVFEMEEGEATIVEDKDMGRLFVLKLDNVSPPDPENEELQQLRGFLETQVTSSVSQDLYSIVAEDFRARAGVDLDYTAINAVHTNFN